MVLKLVLPHVNRMIQAGSVCRWYKSEGDLVEYGEDLCDVRVDIERRQLAHPLSDVIRLLTGTRQVPAQELKREEVERPPYFFVRLTSSDTGFVRRICTHEGVCYAVGDLLAVLTTDPDERLDLTDRALTQASTFRIATSIV